MGFHTDIGTQNAQLPANTLEGIVKQYDGRMRVTVDLDRQSFPFATPAEL